MDLLRWFRRPSHPVSAPPVGSAAPAASAGSEFQPAAWAVGAGFGLWFETTAGRVEIARVATGEAERTLAELRANVHESGRWPFLLGSEDGVGLIWDVRSEWDGDVEALLREANALDPEAVLAARLADVLPTEEEDPEVTDDLGLDFDPATLVVLDVPFEVESSLATERATTVFLATIPTANSWEAPAHLGYGGWNDYPHVAEHVAMLRHWHARHGAELVALTGDVVELRPARPVMDPAEAKILAREWFAYSSDNVYQGVGSLPELAQALLGAQTWTSWWD